MFQSTREGPRQSLAGTLQVARANGLEPSTIIDVGVDRGTPGLYEVFDGVRYLLIEPLAERGAELDALCARLGNATRIEAAAASRAGELVLNVHADTAGSSLLKETDGPECDGSERTVPVVTVDDVCREHDTRGPYLLKVDTQGSELDVLGGAERILAETELVVLEASLYAFQKGGPQFYDITDAMRERGFVIWDIFGGHYRPLDGALAQVDLVFAREHGPLRESHRFASVAQRESHERRLRDGWTGRLARKLGLR